MDLAVSVGAVSLSNPVLTASGTCGLGDELADFVDLGQLGAVTVKSLSAEPWPGNPAPRLHPLPAGMLNSVGLQNPGVAAWATGGLVALAGRGARVVVSIWGSSVEEYARAAQLVAEAAASPAGRALVAVEVNISCPNVEDRRRMFAHSTTATRAAIGAAASGLAGSGLPLWAKLSPNVTDLVELAEAALDAGAAGLTLINTVMGLALDPLSGRPRLGAGGGGLSGPAIHPVAVRAVYDVRAAFPAVPIVGVGGISNGRDAAELLVAGADAVAVGSATFADPRAPVRVLTQLQRFCRDHGVRRVVDLRNRAQRPA